MVDPATERIRTRSVRTIALLGLLVARTGSPQSRAAIAGVFWPESGDAQALTNLRRELHQLRRILGEDDESLEVTSSQLCWHDTGRHRVDLGTFLRERHAALDATSAEDEIEHGLAALEQYAGDLLPGLDDEWLDGVRAELRQMCVQLCDAVSAAALSSGRPRVAMEAMRKRILIDPYDEEAYRTLMELQAGRGDRAGAIRTYHRLATALELDLGVTPDPETAASLTRIMGPGPTFGPAGTAEATRSGPTRADLVGRTAELDRLLETWRRATSGRAEVVVVYGGAGVGKTRLVSELESHARQQGAVVAVTRCFDSTGRLSLSPVADWLREPTISAARARLEPPWRVEADRLVPMAAEEPGRAAAVRVDVQETHDVWQRHRFFEGVARALLVVHRPTLLVLDNVQWCDQDTLSFTAFLMNLAPEAPLLLAVTARPDPDEVNPATGPWLSLLRESDVLSEVTLAPLDADQTATLAGSVTGRVPTRSRRGPDARRHRRISPVRRGGGADRRHRGQVGHRHGLVRHPPPAAPADQPGRSRDGRPGGRPRPRLLAVVAGGGERPRRGHGRGRRGRAVAAPDRPRVPGRLRLLPRPAARRGVRAGEPAAAVAAPPPAGPGARADAGRRVRCGRGPAGRAVPTGRQPRASPRLLPAGRRCHRQRLRPRRGPEPAGLRPRAARDRAGGPRPRRARDALPGGDRPDHAGPATGTRTRGWRRSPRGRSSWPTAWAVPSSG